VINAVLVVTTAGLDSDRSGKLFDKNHHLKRRIRGPLMVL
jgi:hypothetical protein